MINQEYEHIVHPLKPVYKTRSNILILGSFPSVKSREDAFYYSNKYNRFRKVLSSILGTNEPTSTVEKIEMLNDANIAIYDVIYSCDIIKSYDSSIKNVVPTDINKIITEINIKKIYTNGNKATDLYKRYSENIAGIKTVSLPSTSPANARYSLEDLIDKWKIIKVRS